MLDKVCNEQLNAIAFPNIKNQYHITPIHSKRSDLYTIDLFPKFVSCVRLSTSNAIDALAEYDYDEFYQNSFGYTCFDKRTAKLLTFFPECETHCEHEEQVLAHLYNYRDGFFAGPDAQRAVEAYEELYVSYDP